MDAVILHAQGIGAGRDAVTDDIHGFLHICFIADRIAEMDPAPIFHPITRIGDHTGVELAVGNNDAEAVINCDHGMAQRDVLHDAGRRPVDDDPVADLKGLVDADEQAAHDGRDHRLRGKAEDSHDKSGAAQQDGAHVQLRVDRLEHFGKAEYENNQPDDLQEILPVQTAAELRLIFQIRDHKV